MSTLKINWGSKIAVLYGGFVLLIATLVIGSMRQDFDLVSADYYQQELKYQEVIDAGKNQAILSSPVAIAADKDSLHVTFPAEFKGNITKGHLQFYSPVNAAWDKEYSINTAETFAIARNELHKTAYEIKIRWTANDKEYYQESKINLGK